MTRLAVRRAFPEWGPCLLGLRARPERGNGRGTRGTSSPRRREQRPRLRHPEKTLLPAWLSAKAIKGNSSSALFSLSLEIKARAALSALWKVFRETDSVPQAEGHRVGALVCGRGAAVLSQEGIWFPRVDVGSDVSSSPSTVWGLDERLQLTSLRALGCGNDPSAIGCRGTAEGGVRELDVREQRSRLTCSGGRKAERTPGSFLLITFYFCKECFTGTLPRGALPGDPSFV